MKGFETALIWIIQFEDDKRRTLIDSPRSYATLAKVNNAKIIIIAKLKLSWSTQLSRGKFPWNSFFFFESSLKASDLLYDCPIATSSEWISRPKDAEKVEIDNFCRTFWDRNTCYIFWSAIYFIPELCSLQNVILSPAKCGLTHFWQRELWWAL